MAARKSGSRLEIEIERCRSEGQWNKIPELVRQLLAKSVSNDDHGELLLGQCKLQTYLKELPINQGVRPRGTTPKLVEIRKHFIAALDRGTLKADYLQEASLLMAKLCYVEGEYKDALAHYSRVNLDELQHAGAPVFRLFMIAEAYATKGLCLEKVPAVSPILSDTGPSRKSMPERLQEILTCYEKSGDIALLYLQEMEKVMSAGMQNHSPTPGPVTQDLELGYFLEMDLQKTHIIHFTNGDLMQRVVRFREILRAVETRTTQNLCMTMARQLAEILLRGMCEQSYWSPWGAVVGSSLDPPTVSPLDNPKQQDLPITYPLDYPIQQDLSTASPLDDPTQQGHTHTKDYTLSQHPQLYSGDNLFCPQENREELLLLLISESIANHIPEHNHRIISLQSASLVYDLLTIALGRRGYEMLSECLERAMKFAFDEFHLWYQWALSLMATGKSARAVKVLKECIRLKPDDPTIPLLAVKLCIGPLHWLDEGECFAKMVLDMGNKAADIRAKGYLAIGLVYSLKATDASLRGTQDDYQRKALAALQRAQSLSPTDHLAAFYLALQLAVSRQIPEALGYVRQALQLQGDYVHSLHLLALLLSAQKHYHDAFDVIEMALSKYPKNFNLLYTKVKLETLCREPQEALLTCKHMLHIWKSFYNLTNPTDSIRGVSLMDRAIADKRQLNPMALPDFSNPGTSSVHATSIADSRVEQTLSEVASSLQSSAAKHSPLNPWMTLSQIWLHTAEVFIGMSKLADAMACTKEAANLFPTSHKVLYMRGRGAELRGNMDEAKRWYEEALSINPTHVKTMQRLGVILQQLQRYSLSEKVLRDAVQVDCMAHDVWNSLGEVLQAQGNAAAATDCFLIALELEASSPILPFTIIPRAL